jgi:cell division protein FtsW
MSKRVKTDWYLLLTVAMMVAFGLVMVYSASSVVAEVKFKEETYHFAWRQALIAGLSLVALLYLKRRDYHFLQNPAWAFACLGSVLILLLAVYFADSRSHRWFRFFGFQLQPSELAKPALSIFLAYFVTLRARNINNRYTLWPAAMAVACLALCVVIADLGTAVVLVATAAAVFYVAGLERRYIIGAGAVAVLLVGLAIASKPYRLARILGYAGPLTKVLDIVDPKGYVKGYAHSSLATRDTSYQARQSRIAVGAGGVLGAGLMQGTQKLLYLPEAHTDFIYAVVGEELGLWGCTAVLAGFMVILWRGLRLFWMVPDDFGRYLALGITISVVGQALINMGVVLDILPTKGIPLPMISYGGSSLLSTLTSLGLLMSVSDHSG